ncbi:MAG TPA: cupin domain-containing protein [Rhodanobacter sp.]|nr:cupin domain-containing protein [Rhodanobacter sp.]
MFGALPTSDFMADYFEKRPFFGASDASVRLDIDDLLSVMPAALEARRLRAMNPHFGPEGLSTSELMTRLGGYASSGAFLALLNAGDLSFAMQNVESYFPDVARVASEIGKLLDLRVEVTAFLSPAGKGNAATRPHYDRSEVFAQQLVGEKVWEIYAPIDHLPSQRSASLPVDISTMRLLDTHRLIPGSWLYLPRGFVHNVYNSEAGHSLHLSYVGLVDSWTSLFGNLMDAVYADLRDCLTWRQRLGREDLGPIQVSEMLKRMLDEFSSVLLDKAQHLPDRFLDHCLNGEDQRHRLSDGRSSIALLDDANGEVTVAMNGAHFLERHAEQPGMINISSDGDRFYPVSECVLSALRDESPTVDELSSMNMCDQEEFLRTLVVLIKETGIASLRMAQRCERA